MRLTLLAFIFLLMLTLGNAILMRNERASMARSFDPLQLSQRRAAHYEWDAFIWREIAALVLTAVLFGTIQTLAGSSTHDRK